MEKKACSRMTGKVCLFLDFSLENLLVIFVWLRGAVSVLFRLSLMRPRNGIQGGWSSGL